jgi:hypothetical protein
MTEERMADEIRKVRLYEEFRKHPWQASIDCCNCGEPCPTQPEWFAHLADVAVAALTQARGGETTSECAAPNAEFRCFNCGAEKPDRSVCLCSDCYGELSASGEPSPVAPPVSAELPEGSERSASARDHDISQFLNKWFDKNSRWPQDAQDLRELLLAFSVLPDSAELVRLRELSAKWREAAKAVAGREILTEGGSDAWDECFTNCADELDAALSSIGNAPQIAATPERIAEWDRITCEGCREGIEKENWQGMVNHHNFGARRGWQTCTARGKEIAASLDREEKS